MRVKSWFHSISVKLLMTLMGISAFTGLLISVILTAHEYVEIEEMESSQLHSMAEILAPSLTAAVIFQDEITAQELINPLSRQGNIVDVLVTDNQGSIFTHIVNESKSSLAYGSNVNTVEIPLRIEEFKYGTLIIHSDDSEMQERRVFYRNFLLIVMGIVFAISFGLALILRNLFIKPILSLTSVADGVIETRNYSLRAKKLSNDEVGSLTSYFNVMLEKMERREQDLEARVLERTTKLEVANEKLHEQAYRDSLSGLPNRRYLQENIQDYIDRNVKGERTHFALLFIDLDGFKEVNDSMGHDYGDVLLIGVGKRIKNAIREQDTVARMGGDEFNVLLRDIDCSDSVLTIAEKIQAHLAESFFLNGEQVYVTCSIGIAMFPEHGDTVETLIKHADLAMYDAKNIGRNCYQFFSYRMLDDLLEKRRMTDDLRSGIANNEFQLYFQPIIDMQSNAIKKAEALIRWNHPEKGMVPPLEFIGIAEETGLIKELGAWVARTASAEVARLRRELDPDFKVSINVSPSQLKGDSEWMLNWFDYMEELEVDKDAIIVEITENMMMESEDTVRMNLNKLRDKGISIAIDDFGVGYSSLSYLQEMEVDVLKIDRSFVDNIDKDNNSLALCRAMVMIAHQLNISVVAEGVETDMQKHKLIELGCDFGQGYLFDRPMPTEEFTEKYQAYMDMCEESERKKA